MLLTILAIIGKHQELPRERWKLYDHAANVLIQHWDVNKHLRDRQVQADFIGEEDKKELLRRIAYYMQAGEGGLAGNYIPAEQLRGEFEAYLLARYQRDPASAKMIALAMIEQFRQRNFILSRYGADLYGFVHRAFLEYFCAAAFIWQFKETQELSIGQLKRQIFGEKMDERVLA
jgi:predicted NACHT family NTPase